MESATHRNRRGYVEVVLVLGVLGFTGCQSRRIDDAERSPTLPNVVLVLCDDLGWGDVGFHGAPVARTPHLDAMAANGLRLERFYAASPVCSPTRGSVLTGRHPSRYGITGANAGHMLPEELTLAEVLRRRGYATGHFGKWHLGTLTTKVRDSNRGRPGETTHYAPPAMHGFDTYFSTEAKVPTFDPLLVPRELRPGESRHYGWAPRDDDEELTPYGTRYWQGDEAFARDDTLRGDDSRVIMDRAVAFIESAVRAERPFLAVIWFHTPHLPVVAGEEHRKLYADRPLAEQLYFGAISAMDEQVGRLRETLRRLDVAPDTMLWFASDNGPERDTPGSAGPFRGRKRSLYEGGVRVPAVLEWPRRIPEARSTNVPCVTSDYYPTVLAAVGAQPEDQPGPLDGIDLLPIIDGKSTARGRPIGFHFRGKMMWSDDRYKLVVGEGSSEGELFDLVVDPGETTDLASDPEQAKRVETMRRALVAWRSSCEASARGEDYGS